MTFNPKKVRVPACMARYFLLIRAATQSQWEDYRLAQEYGAERAELTAIAEEGELLNDLLSDFIIFPS